MSDELSLFEKANGITCQRLHGIDGLLDVSLSFCLLNIFS